MQIEGDFVILRRLEEADAEKTLKWRLSDRASLLNSGSATVDQQRNWIATRPSNEMNFIIELRPSVAGGPQAAVGMISLVAIDRTNRRAESARFLIGEEDAVKGIPVAVEAMLLLYRLAFDQLELERIYGTVAAENRLMIKWQKYLGMREEGVFRRHLLIDQQFQDAVCLGLLADEYRKTTLPKMKALIAAGRAAAAAATQTQS